MRRVRGEERLFPAAAGNQAGMLVRHSGAYARGGEVMSTSAQVPQDHPLMRAWNAYKATPEYANSKIWAQHAEHVDGSLWALFMAGWQAAIDAALRGEVKP